MADGDSIPRSPGEEDDDEETETTQEEVVRPRRARCWDGCGRPISVCICPYLPSAPIPTSTTIIVLHHPHELRRNPLATLPAILRSLLRVHAVSGRRLRPGSSPILDSLAGSHPPNPAAAIFLFPGPGSTDIAAWAAATPPESRADPVLVVVDGTWNQAREMAAASRPFLSRFAAFVSLGGEDPAADGGSSFDSEILLRKEPFRGCVTTIEAVARALRVLEPAGAGAAVEARLIGVLRAMVGFQARHLKPTDPRPKIRKKKELKRIQAAAAAEVENNSAAPTNCSTKCP